MKSWRRWMRSGARRTGGRRRTCTHHGLACRRRGVPRTWLGRLLTGAVAVVLMLAQVWLANGIVTRRTAVSRLDAEREYLTTRVGGLRLAWHQRTARPEITARAARELGLVEGDGPAPLLLAGPAPRPAVRPWWQRALAAVASGRGVPTVAAREREP